LAILNSYPQKEQEDMPQPHVTEQERNLATFRVLIDRGFSAGDISAVDATCAAGCVEHQDGFTDMESVKGGIGFLHLLASDFQLTIEDVVASGDRVWARLHARGTHTGPVFGGPTGRTFDVTVIDICRFSDGMIVEHWGVPDRLAMMEQLGVMPVPAGAGR
jgi:predicted ester cyclase